MFSIHFKSELKINFSAFASLINRNDLGKVVISQYKLLSTKRIDAEPSIKKGEHSAKQSFTELISAQVNLNNISDSEINDLIGLFISNYNSKKMQYEIYGTLSLSTCAFAINKLMVANNAADKFLTKDKFVIEGNVYSLEILDSILSKAKLYIKD